MAITANRDTIVQIIQNMANLGNPQADKLYKKLFSTDKDSDDYTRLISDAIDLIASSGVPIGVGPRETKS